MKIGQRRETRAAACFGKGGVLWLQSHEGGVGGWVVRQNSQYLNLEDRPDVDHGVAVAMVRGQQVCVCVCVCVCARARARQCVCVCVYQVLGRDR